MVQIWDEVPETAVEVGKIAIFKRRLGQVHGLERSGEAWAMRKQVG